MAFTLAHMAAALPFYRSDKRALSRRWLQFDALLIGTMMPDLPYFIGSSAKTAYLSHQWTGVLTYNLPWGLLVFAIWYWGLKPATYALIQPFLKTPVTDYHNQADISFNSSNYSDNNQRQRRIIGYADSYWSFASIKKRLAGPLLFCLSIVLALILGAATHVVWDGITHADGIIAKHIDWLQYPIYFYPFKGTSIARLLQYLTSIAGLAVLFWFAVSRLQARQRSHPDSQRIENLIGLMLTKKQSLLIAGSFVTICFLLVIQAAVEWYPSLFSSPYSFAAGVSVSVLPSIAILCMGYAALYHLIRFLRETPLWYKGSS